MHSEGPTWVTEVLKMQSLEKSLENVALFAISKTDNYDYSIK